jgi:hypothetical protein
VRKYIVEVIIIVIHFDALFIYLLTSTANGHYSFRTNTNNNMSAQNKANKKQQKQRKMNHFKLLTLKVSVNLHTAFAVETHLTEGQWLEEQGNMLKL